MKIERKFVCMKEAGRILGIDSRTVKKILESTEEIKWTRISGKILINIQSLLDYMDKYKIIRY